MKFKTKTIIEKKRKCNKNMKAKHKIKKTEAIRYAT